ncbi:MAG TPA: MG2 domain-containing protein, partial [Puia sp.]
MTFKCPTWLIINCCCLLSLSSLAQIKSDNYASAWKKVDSLVARNLPQSALTQINLIYSSASKDNNEPQYLKALIYRLGMEEANQDEGDTAAIRDLEKEIPRATQPTLSILQNLLASRYWNYLQQHRYQFYSRTTTMGSRTGDIATWSLQDLHDRIDQLFMASLQNEKLLAATRLESYDPIIIKGNTRALRPTLFDLLAHQALDYFQSGERYLAQPTYLFELDDPAIFADAAGFSQHQFRTSDSLSMHYRALCLLQRLIALHLKDPKPGALIDVDIRRLDFVRQYTVANDKDDLYRNALKHITDRWADLPAASIAWYKQAMVYTEDARNYNAPQDTTGRYGYVKAKEICDKVIAQKDSSEGKMQCLQLLSRIMEKQLEVQIETINMPDQPFRALVTWRNFPRLYGRIVRVDRGSEGLLRNMYQEGAWQKLLQLPLQTSFVQNLPETGDYQVHGAEIKIDALPLGEYALVTCPDSSFRQGRQLTAMTVFYVSTIAFINKDRDYFVLNRQSGQPLVGADVHIWAQKYDYNSSKYVPIRGESYRTDEHGYFKLKKRIIKDYNVNFGLEIKAGKDHLFITNRNYLYDQSPDDVTAASRMEYERDHRRTFFFTDRSIYRPGQTVYFKGILVTQDFDTHRSKILPSFKTRVILYDANRNKLDSLEVTTNDYGSYHGSFRLPSNLLNGQFRIKDDSTVQEQYFSVEEYKRPLFYVSYDTVRGSYQVGDTIRVQGFAKAYAGNNIDGATVNYRVKREARYPCYDCWPLGGKRFTYSQPQEIAHGTVRTDAKGRFIIAFDATPDKNIKKENDPIFTYSISADVTDINGESRSESTTVDAGYKALELSIDKPSEDDLPADSLKKLVVNAHNLSGVPERVTVTVSMYALKAPIRLIRERDWERPDQFIMTKEEYLRDFPHDEYDDERN